MAKKISEVYPDYVFQRLGAGYTVDATDYTRKDYIDLTGRQSWHCTFAAIEGSQYE